MLCEWHGSGPPPTPFLDFLHLEPIQLDVIDYAQHAGDIRLA
jgi:hypothetical protein